MAGTTSDWKEELGRWLKPFLNCVGDKARRQMCPLYVAGLIGPGDRKSVQPMAERFAPGDYDQLHHFVSAGLWDAAPLDTELLIQAGPGGDRSHNKLQAYPIFYRYRPKTCWPMPSGERELAKRHKRPAKSPLCCGPCADR